jgi:hypothetical protein
VLAIVAETSKTTTAIAAVVVFSILINTLCATLKNRNNNV